MPGGRTRGQKIMLKTWQCSKCPNCQVAQIAAESGKIMEPACVSRSDCVTPASTLKVWEFLVSVPHGVLRRSTDVDDFVESSVGFGVAELQSDHLLCLLFLRSSVNSYLKYGQTRLSAFGRRAGAENVENLFPFPAWQPCMDSPLLGLLKRIHAQQFDGKEPRVYAIHAGLECGSLKISHADLDCSSIGPQICGAHSPDERINIASGVRFIT